MLLAAPPAIFVVVIAAGTVPDEFIVTAPVAPDIEIFVPATILVTPVFVIVFAVTLIPVPPIKVFAPLN